MKVKTSTIEKTINKFNQLSEANQMFIQGYILGLMNKSGKKV